MNFSDYLMKRIAAAQQTQNGGATGATGKIDDSVLKNASLFSSLSAEDLAKVDFEQLLATGVGSDDEAINNVLKAFLELEGIQQAADGDESGDMSAQEAQAFIQSILGKDGDESAISMDDLDAVVQELGIDLEAVASTLNEVLNEDKKEEELTPEQVKEAEEKAHPEKAEDADEPASANKTNAPKSTGSAGGAGSSGGAGGAGGVNTGNSTKKTEEAKGETPEEIKKEIEAKNGEIENIESEADKQVEEQEKAKEKAMKQYGVSEEEYQKYQEEEKKIDNQIKEKDNELKEQDKVISDAQSTIKSNESYISDIDAQISSNKEALSKVSSDDENAGNEKAEIESKISNLENEKQAKEDENKKLENETIKNAEDQKKQIETEKAELEKQKQELLEKTLGESKGFCSGMPSDAKEGVKNQIMQYDDKIKEINDKKTKDVAEVQKDITKLEAKLKTAEAKNDRNEFLKENAANKFDFNFEECLTDANKQELAQLKKTFEAHREEYEKVAEATGVPAELICAIHYREGSCNFGTYLHNGDPLGKPTTHVPAGKNFDNWTDAAIDALKSGNPSIIKDGDFDSCMEYAERYNGLGYRKRGLASPYVWAGTTNYTGGMYVADGQFSATAKDKRVGVAVMMKYLSA